MIACFDCRNLTNFTHVSDRGDARSILQTHLGTKVEPFVQIDDREPGLYCGRCNTMITCDLESEGLLDRRVASVAPGDFDVDAMASELRALRPDADWSQMELPAQDPTFGETPAGLHPDIIAALQRTRRLPMYCHQTEAIELGLAGRNFVLATPAGSGKSIGLLAPVLDRLLRDPTATAIVIFPMKALANDQMNALVRLGVDADPWVNTALFTLRLTDDSVPIMVGRYDGSTKDHERPAVRAKARLLIATPDMLHVGILRNVMGKRASFKPFFDGLALVVLDELHTYQGVFGSNVAQVMRRLRRLTDLAGRTVQFMTASATIGNPVELAERLTGAADFQLVDHDGSSRRRRVVLICNPPERAAEGAATKAQTTKKGRTTDPSEVGRIAPQTIAIEMIGGGALASAHHLPVRTIAFARARQTVFQLTQRIRNHLKELHRGDLADTVAPYAATFLADDREDAEDRLRDGSTLAIVSTSALELGIDIPELSLAVLVGYPGQISSFRQRAGRVGRAGEGLAVLIVGDDPLQQYLARDPFALANLLQGRAEDVVISTEIPELVRRFGLIPAMEETNGLAYEDAEYFGTTATNDMLGGASGAPTTSLKGRDYWRMDYTDEPFPGLRSGSRSRSFTVMNQSGRDFTAVGTIDDQSAMRDAFVPAVWTGSEGQTYVVTGWDPKKLEIYCEGPRELSYLTRGIPVDTVRVDDESESKALHGATVGYSGLHINRFVPSYREQHHSGIERTVDCERSWPRLDFDTHGVFLRFPLDWFGELPRDESIKAVEHILLSVAPIVVACDPSDLEGSHSGTTVYIYDSFGGGLRLSEPAYHRLDEVVALAYRIVSTCPCDRGCPSCVMLPRRPDGNRDLSKRGALQLLQHLMGTP